MRTMSTPPNFTTGPLSSLRGILERDIVHLHSDTRSGVIRGDDEKIPLATNVNFTDVTAFAQECPNDDFRAFCETNATVLRLLSYPTYTVSDEKVLNRAGDMAALAVIRNVSVEGLNSPEKARQVLLILKLAFAAPRLMTADADRRPNGAMLLLDYLSTTKYKSQHVNEIENARREILYNSSTGQPSKIVMPEGAPPLDVEHTQWVDSVLRWTLDIKPGMTRRDLLRVYTEEGGLSFRTPRTYALKGCPYLKVEVEFEPVGPASDGQIESPNDKIVRISKPCLEYSISD
jgi:hypothetical protein